MKKLYTASLLLILCLLMPASVMAQQRESFPGAEGYGRYTTGGRGGKVYHVTTLEDNSQPGSFRYACNQSGARTIVFDVSGTIFLKSALQLKKGNVTIAGQTAPGDGICIADYPFTINTSNVIIRFMRFRLGNRQVAFHEGDGLGGMDQSNIMIDHCSVSWSIDECLSVYGSKNITVQWCISSQSLRNSGHSKGAHGYGGNWGGSGASYHHNLIAHHCSRTPRLGPRPGTQTDERMDMRNNVIYNHGSNGCYGAEGMNVNIVNNYYKVGPQKNNHPQRIAGIGIRTSEYTKHDTASPNDWDVMWHKWGTFYVNGNVNPTYSAVTRDNWTYGIYNEIDNSKCDNTFNAQVRQDMKLDTPIEYLYTTTHTAEKAYEKVLAYVGASLHRDALDEIIVNDVSTGTAKFGENGIIDNQDQIKYSDGTTGWPALKQSAAEVDTDGDGMPDEWEKANGLDPANPKDGATVAKDGYTNLEHYINSLVEEIMVKGNEDGKMLSGNLEITDPAVELPGYGSEPEVPETASWDISSKTAVTTENGKWEFDNNIIVTCSNSSRGYAAGSKQTADFVKFGRGETYTVTIPEGYIITGVKLKGYANVDDKDGSVIIGDNEYTLVTRTAAEPSEHEIEFPKPVKALEFKIGDACQMVFMITLNIQKSNETGIRDIISDTEPAGNDRIYNLMGIEVKGELTPGIYIRNGKKFLVK